MGPRLLPCWNPGWNRRRNFIFTARRTNQRPDVIVRPFRLVAALRRHRCLPCWMVRREKVSLTRAGRQRGVYVEKMAVVRAGRWVFERGTLDGRGGERALLRRRRQRSGRVDGFPHLPRSQVSFCDVIAGRHRGRRHLHAAALFNPRRKLKHALLLPEPLIGRGGRRARKPLLQYLRYFGSRVAVKVDFFCFRNAVRQAIISDRNRGRHAVMLVIIFFSGTYRKFVNFFVDIPLLGYCFVVRLRKLLDSQHLVELKLALVLHQGRPRCHGNVEIDSSVLHSRVSRRIRICGGKKVSRGYRGRRWIPRRNIWRSFAFIRRRSSAASWILDTFWLVEIGAGVRYCFGFCIGSARQQPAQTPFSVCSKRVLDDFGCFEIFVFVLARLRVDYTR